MNSQWKTTLSALLLLALVAVGMRWQASRAQESYLQSAREIHLTMDSVKVLDEVKELERRAQALSPPPQMTVVHTLLLQRMKNLIQLGKLIEELDDLGKSQQYLSDIQNKARLRAKQTAPDKKWEGSSAQEWMSAREVALKERGAAVANELDTLINEDNRLRDQLNKELRHYSASI